MVNLVEYFFSLGVAGSLIAAFLWAVAAAILLFLRKKIQDRFGSNLNYFFNVIFLNKNNFFILSFIVLVLNFLFLFYKMPGQLILLNIIFLIFIWFSIKQLNAAGIFGADAKIKEGLNYESVLKLVERDFKFIGTGARKLTENKDAFKRAIGRVNSVGKTAKFILCDENSKALEDLALRAQVNGKEYKKNVKTSREEIEELIEEGFKIEIRKYSGDDISKMPIFRLTLINGNFCLVSYSLFNDPKHKGEELPQVYLGDAKNDRGYSVSLYHGFDKYFDSLWDELAEKD